MKTKKIRNTIFFKKLKRQENIFKDKKKWLKTVLIRNIVF